MGILHSKPKFFQFLNHMAILAEPQASDFGLSLDRLLKTGLTVYTSHFESITISQTT